MKLADHMERQGGARLIPEKTEFPHPSAPPPFPCGAPAEAHMYSDAWNNVDHFRVDQAAYLWAGHEPPVQPSTPLYSLDGDPAGVAAYIQMLTGAIEAGKLQTIDGGTLRNSFCNGRDLLVSRLGLICFARSRRIVLPDFLKDAGQPLFEPSQEAEIQQRRQAAAREAGAEARAQQEPEASSAKTSDVAESADPNKIVRPSQIDRCLGSVRKAMKEAPDGESAWQASTRRRRHIEVDRLERLLKCGEPGTPEPSTAATPQVSTADADRPAEEAAQKHFNSAVTREAGRPAKRARVVIAAHRRFVARTFSEKSRLAEAKYLYSLFEHLPQNERCAQDTIYKFFEEPYKAALRGAYKIESWPRFDDRAVLYDLNEDNGLNSSAKL